jgi:membrane dipeptidase
MPGKRYAGYRSFQYLEEGKDYRAFPLAAELGRVPPYDVPLSADEQQRVDRILKEHPVISLHDHTSVFPEDVGQIFEHRRHGRDWTGYAGLAASHLDAVFENFMDGTALITSQAGWKWDDIIWDLGMRYSDLAHQELVFRAETLPDVLRAKETGRIALIPALEAATPIENELDRVDVLYGLGVRCMGITYSESNGLGSGLRERRDGGLTQFGHQVVRRMNRLGMAIDVAHSGDQTSLDTVAASQQPVFITHAGARALWDTARMKPDAVIKACAEKGGVIGIEAAPHTTLTAAHPEHSLESVMDHMAYCIELVGAEHVALGPDTLFGDHVGLHRAFAAQLSLSDAQGTLTFPRVPYVLGMESPAEALPNAVKWLVKHGYTDSDLARVIGGNVLRVLGQVWCR